MDEDNFRVQKVRTLTTHQGCRVRTVSSFNPKTRCVDEEITLEHPGELVQTAFHPDTIATMVARGAR